MRRAAHDRRPGIRTGVDLRDTEVGEQQSLVGFEQADTQRCRGLVGLWACDQEVRGFDVTMDHVDGMERSESRGHRVDDRSQCCGVDGAGLGRHSVGERPPAGVFHDEVWPAIVQLADVEHGDQVRVIHASENSCFGQEPLAELGLPSRCRFEDLDGDIGVECRVVGANNAGETTDAEQRLDAVPADCLWLATGSRSGRRAQELSRSPTSWQSKTPSSIVL